MAEEYSSTLDRVNYNRWTNKAKNAKSEIARAFLAFAFILKEIKENSYHEFKYNNFRQFCDEELGIDWRSAYDYIKIADFVEDNKNYLSVEKAELLGHKKLKLLSQKLSAREVKFRKAILKNIHESDSYMKIKEKIEISGDSYPCP
ncbi:MAG: hypothetical protein QUS13_08000 [Smithella sp.]|nr:hypothetical protein [Smithella sp.]